MSAGRVWRRDGVMVQVKMWPTYSKRKTSDSQIAHQALEYLGQCKAERDTLVLQLRKYDSSPVLDKQFINSSFPTSVEVE
jgi:hypothetical protein